LRAAKYGSTPANTNVFKCFWEMPFLARILIYPIKSLDGISVERATVTAGGALEHDREFALVDSSWKFVNAKRFPDIHRIRSQFNLTERTALLQHSGGSAHFHLDTDKSKLEAWFSDFFGIAVKLSQNTVQGFPDDLTATGPTVTSSATLSEIATWFDGLSEQDMRLRFRANLEIGGVDDAFWEDRLFGLENDLMPFRIGDVRLYGVNPCQRCVVPTRDALTGDTISGFQKHFSEKRRATLPMWAEPSRFNHFYKLSVNTLVPASEVGKTLRVGDEVFISPIEL